MRNDGTLAPLAAAVLKIAVGLCRGAGALSARGRGKPIGNAPRIRLHQPRLLQGGEYSCPKSHKELDQGHKLKAAAPFILVTVFLDMLCIGIIIPVLPQLIRSFLGGSVSIGWPNGGQGIFGCAWGLAQFVFSPIQGGLSDHFGRRPVVLASNFGTGVDLILMAIAPESVVVVRRPHRQRHDGGLDFHSLCLYERRHRAA